MTTVFTCLLHLRYVRWSLCGYWHAGDAPESLNLRSKNCYYQGLHFHYKLYSQYFVFFFIVSRIRQWLSGCTNTSVFIVTPSLNVSPISIWENSTRFLSLSQLSLLTLLFYLLFTFCHCYTNKFRVFSFLYSARDLQFSVLLTWTSAYKIILNSCAIVVATLSCNKINYSFCYA